jgi:hypothetical protein
LGKIKKGERVAELQKQLHLSKDERHQMLLYEQIGEIQLYNSSIPLKILI